MDHSVNMTVETEEDLEHEIVEQSDILASESFTEILAYIFGTWLICHCPRRVLLIFIFDPYHLNVIACHCQYS